MSLRVATRRALLRKQTYAEKVLAYSPIAYWIQGEASGGVSFDEGNSARDGAYTGVTLGQPGIGDGRTSPLYDGANDFDNVATASLQGAFDGDEGTLMAWARVSAAGVWTDVAFRNIVTFQVDGANLALVRKSNANNTLEWVYIAGAVSEVTSRGGNTQTDWFSVVYTWSAAADQAIAYFNGAQEGAIDTVLGAWVGVPAIMVIGASTIAPALVWDGYLAHVAAWDRALTPAEVAELAVV